MALSSEDAITLRSPGAVISVLIVDDHDILRYGVRALLRGHPHVQVIGEADSVAQALQQARALVPDVILMDAQLPDGSGIDACREILSWNPTIRVLFFSAHSDDQTLMMTLLAGAAGHVSKDLDCDKLVAAIHQVARGEPVFDPNIRNSVLGLVADASKSLQVQGVKTRKLAPQEERVMALVVEGKTNKEIAAALGLSDKTIENYLRNAFQKLGVGRRAHAASVFDIERLKQRLLPGPRSFDRGD
jgi:DNA-binding NarL/FixJ family response regulator